MAIISVSLKKESNQSPSFFRSLTSSLGKTYNYLMMSAVNQHKYPWHAARKLNVVTTNTLKQKSNKNEKRKISTRVLRTHYKTRQKNYQYHLTITTCKTFH